MPKQKTRRERLESLVSQIVAITDECEREVIDTIRVCDAIRVEIESSEINRELTGDPITAEGLSEFLDYSEGGKSWQASTGRLHFWCRANGEWGLYFESTYGGNVGSYRRLKTINEVKTLVELLGVMTREQLMEANK